MTGNVLNSTHWIVQSPKQLYRYVLFGPHFLRWGHWCTVRNVICPSDTANIHKSQVSNPRHVAPETMLLTADISLPCHMWSWSQILAHGLVLLDFWGIKALIPQLRTSIGQCSHTLLIKKSWREVALKYIIGCLPQRSDSAGLGQGPGICIVHSGDLWYRRKSTDVGTESSSYCFSDLRRTIFNFCESVFPSSDWCDDLTSLRWL